MPVLMSDRTLAGTGSADLAAQRSEYESGGWSHFDEMAETDPVEAYKERKAVDPIVAPFPR